MNSSNYNNRMPFFRYFPRAIKFYGINNDKLASFVFVILLGINFCTNIFADKLVSNFNFLNTELLKEDISSFIVPYSKMLIKLSAIGFGTFILTSIILAFYNYAYIRDLRGIPYSFAQCIGEVSKKLIKVIIVSIIISLAVFVGSLFFMIPGIILYVMFIFSYQFIIDQDRSILDSLKSSLNLTNGFKVGIFIVILIFYIIKLSFPTFVEYANGPLVFSFVSAFITTIFDIVYQRFLTLMYFDLEYIRKSRKINIDV